MTRVGCGALLLLVAVVVGGAVAVVRRDAFFGPDVFSLCPDDRASTTVVRPSRMLEEARAYTGPGPHRIIVDGPSYATDALPVDWVPQRRSNGVYQVEVLELVACEYRYAVGAEGDLNTCGYKTVGGDSVYAFITQSAKYDYRVFEAATGRLLTTFTVAGAVKVQCGEHRTVYGRPTSAVKSPAEPDMAELKRQLEPLVTLPVG